MFSKSNLFVTLLSIFLLFCAFNQISAQSQIDIIKLKSAGCEIDEMNFSIVESAAREILNENSFLIAVARLGSKDKARNLNQQRLSATKEWIVGKAHFPSDKLILTVGEKVNDNGRIEFYIGGMLTYIIFPKPNRYLCWECCDPQPKDFSTGRKNRKKQS